MPPAARIPDPLEEVKAIFSRMAGTPVFFAETVDNNTIWEAVRQPLRYVTQGGSCHAVKLDLKKNIPREELLQRIELLNGILREYKLGEESFFQARLASVGHNMYSCVIDTRPAGQEFDPQSLRNQLKAVEQVMIDKAGAASGHEEKSPSATVTTSSWSKRLGWPFGGPSKIDQLHACVETLGFPLPDKTAKPIKLVGSKTHLSSIRIRLAVASEGEEYKRIRKQAERLSTVLQDIQREDDSDPAYALECVLHTNTYSNTTELSIRQARHYTKGFSVDHILGLLGKSHTILQGIDESALPAKEEIRLNPEHAELIRNKFKVTLRGSLQELTIDDNTCHLVVRNDFNVKGLEPLGFGKEDIKVTELADGRRAVEIPLSTVLREFNLGHNR